MTNVEALLIKGWRAKGATWRRIAEYAADEWPDRDYDSGNQLEGRELCLEAAKTLNEDHGEFPWD